MVNEQAMLSEELTLKQNELLKSEREKLQMERQVMELNHVKCSLKNTTENQRGMVEDNTRGEFERNKLNQKVRELETQLLMSRKDTEELSVSYQKLVQEKNQLMQQLTLFEKDSFEIQARVKRGLEAEREVQTQGNQVENLKDQKRDVERQLEQKTTETELKQNEILRLHQKLETVQSYNATLEKDISETREQVAKLNGEVNNGQDVTLKTQNMKDKAELQIVDLQQSLTLLKDEKMRMQNDFGQCQKDLGSE